MKKLKNTIKTLIGNRRYAPICHPREIYDNDRILQNKIVGKIRFQNSIDFFSIDEVK